MKSCISQVLPVKCYQPCVRVRSPCPIQGSLTVQFRRYGTLSVTRRSYLCGSGSILKYSAVSSSRRASGPHKLHISCDLPQPFPSSAERTVQLPINYYKCLDVSTESRTQAMQLAVDRLCQDTPHEEYSDAAMHVRGQILQAAGACLMDSDSKKAYDQSLESGDTLVEVPWSQIPGTLALLQEAGAAEAVVQVGSAYLNEASSALSRRDVALAVALSYSDLAAQLLADSANTTTEPRISQGCDMLDNALTVLQDHGGSTLARTLQDDIEQTLEEMTPACLVELLRLEDVPENAEARENAFSQLQDLLYAPVDLSNPVMVDDRNALFEEACKHLTSHEQVALRKGAPSGAPTQPKEVHTAALASVAVGVTQKNPKLVQEARGLLKTLQESGASQDVTTEIAMCEFLLGNVEEAIDILQLETEEGDPNIRRYVMDNGGPDDMLAGMCALADNWVMTVLAAYRDTRPGARGASITAWFDDPAIQDQLEAIARDTSPVAQAVTLVRSASTAIQDLTSPLLQWTGAKSEPTASDPGRRLDQGTPSDEDSTAAGDAKRPATSGSAEDTSGEGGEQLSGKADAAAEGGLPFGGPKAYLALAVLGGAVLLGGAMMTRQHHHSGAAAQTAAKAPSTSQSTPAPTTMDEAAARKVVQKWQDVKAQALGGSHNVALLDSILSDEMLQQWRARAQDVQKEGWFWEYHLVDLKVDLVKITDAGNSAVVQATLQEAAQLHDGGKQGTTDAYQSTYVAKYELRWKPELKDWRIISGGVMYS